MQKIITMHEYKKLYTLLQMIALLNGSSGYDIKRLARKFDMSERNMYRYLTLLKNCGFNIVKDTNQRLRIEKADEILTREGVFFSLEEAATVKEAILSVHSTNPLRNRILTKLFAHSELDATAELLYDRILGEKIRLLNRAMKENLQVLLKDYHSMNSNTVTDRLVEPFAFVQNMKYFNAYEPENKSVRQFKPDRTGEVIITQKPFQYQAHHKNAVPDFFGMASGEKTTVHLKLSERAARLLCEEIPEAATGLDKSKNTWQGTVKGHEGIGRFILGLPGEVEILAPDVLKKYVQDKVNLTDTVSAQKGGKVIH